MFESSYQLQEAQSERVRYVSTLVNEWDKAIRQVMSDFAKVRWPPIYVLGFIPIRSYRLRSRQVGPVVYIWWVEYDIPPFDKYQCAAYQVQLSLGIIGQPVITVQSGERVYTVSPLAVEALEATLAEAGRDVPLIIPRAMGRVEG